MTQRQEYRKRAKDIYGPTADVIRVSDVKNRDQRFGVAYIEVGGIGSPKRLVVAGYGANWDDAFKMAEGNPIAIEQAKMVLEVKALQAEYLKNPQEFANKYGRQKLGLAEQVAETQEEKQNEAKAE